MKDIKRKSEVWLRIGLLTVALIGVYYFARIPMKRSLVHQQMENGAQAPDFSFVNAKGETKKLSEYQNKSAVLINFWASWCQPCIVEMPSLRRLEEQLGAKGLEVLALCLEGDPNEPVPQDWPSQIIFNFQPQVLDTYQVEAVPESYLVGKNGKILKVYSGPREWDEPAMLSEIEGFLN